MKAFVKYLITASAGLVIAVTVMLLSDIFTQTEALTVLKILCDSFTVSSVMLIGSGLLVYSYNSGVFDPLTYSARKFMLLFYRDFDEKVKKNKPYFEYTAEKHEKKAGFAHILLTGLIFLTLTIIFLLIYYNI